MRVCSAFDVRIFVLYNVPPCLNLLLFNSRLAKRLPNQRDRGERVRTAPPCTRFKAFHTTR